MNALLGTVNAILGFLDARLTAHVPEQPLLGDGLGHHPPETRFDSLNDPARRLRRWIDVPLALDRRERVAKALRDATEEAAVVLGRFAGRILVGNFAVQLVPVLPDRNEEHVH